jgi:hypothetical protein
LSHAPCPKVVLFWWNPMLSISSFIVWIPTHRGTEVCTRDLVLARQVLCCLSLISSSFCSGYFRDRASLSNLDWSQITILLISASQVTRITGVSY